jgi:hypothetical protein
MGLRLFVVLAIAWLVFSPTIALAQASSSVPGADTPEGQIVMGKLDSIIIPKVDFDGTSIQAIVDFLNLKSKELDPQHEGVQFNVVLPPENDPKGARIRYQVTLKLENVPLSAVLDYVCQMANIDYRIVGGGVVLEKP